MVNGISSLQPKACTFVVCQFTSSPKDAASLAIVLNYSALEIYSVTYFNSASSSATARGLIDTQWLIEIEIRIYNPAFQLSDVFVSLRE